MPRDKYIIGVVVATGIIGGAMLIGQAILEPDSFSLASESSAPKGRFPRAASTPGRVRVAEVVDGDTLRLKDGCIVRLIGVNTPELHHPEVPVQRFAEGARRFTKKQVEGFEVSLQYGRGPKKDAYGRILAYVYLGNTCLNLQIIRRGYGYAYTRFPFSRQEEFVAAEKEARVKQYGLWNYSLSDGRIANLAHRYEMLSKEGKARLDAAWDKLLEEYPADQVGREDHGSQ